MTDTTVNNGEIMADKEILSAFFDDEKVNLTQIDLTQKQHASEETWKSYSTIRDVMQGELADKTRWDIVSRVALALENEPEHSKVSTAENKIRHFSSNGNPLSEQQPTPKEARKFQPTWLQQLTQIGVAASVAFAVILGVQQYSGSSQGYSTIQPPVLHTMPLQGAAQPVSLRTDTFQQSPTEAQVAERRKRVNALFNDYELQLRLNLNGTQHGESAEMQKGMKAQ